jgi:hypothetical protein
VAILYNILPTRRIPGVGIRHDDGSIASTQQADESAAEPGIRAIVIESLPWSAAGEKRAEAGRFAP